MGRGNSNLPTKHRSAAVSHGALRDLSERLNLDNPRWSPPYFGGFSPNYVILFCASGALFPTPKWGRGRNAQLPKKQRGAAEDQGSPRNATEPGEAPKFGYPELESAVFWWPKPELSYILRSQHTKMPKTQMGKAGECENTCQTKGRRGTPRGATEPGGAPKFGYPELRPTIFWRICPEISNILRARRPLSQQPNGKGGDASDETKGAPRIPAGSHRTLRAPKGRLNLDNPNWNPPYFSGPRPNYVILYAPCAPLSPTPKCGRGGRGTKLPAQQRVAAERQGTLRRLAGRLNFGGAFLESAIFRRAPPNFVIFFFRRAPRSPIAHRGKGDANLPTKKGAARGVTGRYGN